MFLAEVIGNIVAEKKTDWLSDPTFLLVREVDREGTACGDALVALDTLGALQGEIVLVTQGSSCRQTEETVEKPVDALIAGIVDRADWEGGAHYIKDLGFSSGGRK